MWKNAICTGCEKQCRYRDFRVDVVFQETYEARLRRSREAAENGDYSVRTGRSSILGQMHEVKRRYWESFVKACPGRTQLDGTPYEFGDAAILKPFHPVDGNARQKAFLMAVPKVFSMRDARAVLPELSRGGVLKFVTRLVQRGLVVRLDHDKYLVSPRDVVHVCRHFDAVLVDAEAGTYWLRCTGCGGEREIGTPLPF